jgi:cysteine synthase
MKSMLSNSILDAIGNTPMLEVEGVYCKLEYLNPSGSIKARIAKYMIERAAQRGEVRLEAITSRVAFLPTDLVRH